MVTAKPDDGTIPDADKESSLDQYGTLTDRNFEVYFATSYFDYVVPACVSEYTYTIDDTATATSYGVAVG